VLSVSFWRRLKRAQNAEKHTWTFERKAYLGFGLLSTLVTLGMLLIVAANISNVVHPQAGFAQSIPDLGTPQVGTHKAALHQAVATWVQSGNASLPSLLEDEVHNRLAWQRPKAIVCSLLFMVLAGFTAHLWRRLIHLRASEAAWSLKEKALIITGGAGHSYNPVADAYGSGKHASVVRADNVDAPIWLGKGTRNMLFHRKAQMLAVLLTLVVCFGGTVSAQPTERCFPETGQCIAGPIRAY